MSSLLWPLSLARSLYSPVAVCVLVFGAQRQQRETAGLALGDSGAQFSVPCTDHRRLNSRAATLPVSIASSVRRQHQNRCFTALILSSSGGVARLKSRPPPPVLTRALVRPGATCLCWPPRRETSLLSLFRLSRLRRTPFRRYLLRRDHVPRSTLRRDLLGRDSSAAVHPLSLLHVAYGVVM